MRRVPGDAGDSDSQCNNCAHTAVSLETFVSRVRDVVWPEFAQPLLDGAPLSNAIAALVRLGSDFRVAPHLLPSPATVLEPEQAAQLAAFLAETFSLTTSVAGTYAEPYHLCLGDFAFCRRHAVPTRAILAALCEARQFREAETLIVKFEQTTGRRLRPARVFYNAKVRNLI